MSTPTIFVDANIFFAATKSPNGGSALILLLAKSGKIKIITVKQALWEAEQNILKKLGIKYVDKYYQLILESFDIIFPSVLTAEFRDFYKLSVGDTRLTGKIIKLRFLILTIAVKHRKRSSFISPPQPKSCFCR